MKMDSRQWIRGQRTFGRKQNGESLIKIDLVSVTQRDAMMTRSLNSLLFMAFCIIIIVIFGIIKEDMKKGKWQECSEIHWHERRRALKETTRSDEDEEMLWFGDDSSTRKMQEKDVRREFVKKNKGMHCIQDSLFAVKVISRRSRTSSPNNQYKECVWGRDLFERHPVNQDERKSAETFKDEEGLLSLNGSFILFFAVPSSCIKSRWVSFSKETENQFPCLCKKRRTMKTVLGIRSLRDVSKNISKKMIYGLCLRSSSLPNHELECDWTIVYCQNL